MSLRTAFATTLPSLAARLSAAIPFALLVALGAPGCSDDAFCFNCDRNATAGAAGASGRGGGAGAGGDTCVGCTADQACCLGKCVDPKIDVGNCGACSNQCTAPTGSTASCVAGVCKTGVTCPAGTADCNVDGTCESTLATDTKNCGGCGKVCPASTTGAAVACVAGQCVTTACPAGKSDCNGSSADGCETDTASNPATCGGCNTKCPTTDVANAVRVCRAGACTFDCKVGYGDCNGNPEDGCETNLTTSPDNCGVCNGKCGAVAHGVPSCVEGTCKPKCDTLFGDCNGAYADGCELPLGNDAKNCAKCGAACPNTENGEAPACDNGSCNAGTCQLGFNDCKASVAGCETDVSSDIANCGVCNNKCGAVLNGTAKCDFFECTVGSCDAGFGNCFGGIVDGCETDLNQTIEHCGKCGNDCGAVANGSPSCVAGACEVKSCDTGFDDCDGDFLNGCEAALKTSQSDCGVCGNNCANPINGKSACVDGGCKLTTCSPGFGNCNNNDADGCETPTQVDPNNCGACDFRCGSGVCDGGVCVPITKVLVLRDNDTSPPDETQVLTDYLTAELNVDPLKPHVVEVSSSRIFTFDGTNPPLFTNGKANYGTILVLAGSAGPTGGYSTDMPAAGQRALVDHVEAANGLVVTEWAAHYVRQGLWAAGDPGQKKLSDFVLLDRTIAFSGQVDYSIDPAFKSHPIWAGFTDAEQTFTVNSASNLGVARLGQGIKRVATSTAVVDPVAILELPNIGRVAHIAHSGNYSPRGWSCAPTAPTCGRDKLRRLLVNAIRWTAREN